MKLRKQTPAKALVTLATLLALLGFWSVVRAEDTGGDAAGPAAGVDYDRFFSPAAGVAAEPAAAEPVRRPHTRSRAS